MKIRHELCLDHHDSQTRQMSADILTALGHGPTLKLADDGTAGNVVHGSVTVAYCNTRTLGVDVLMFRDGHTEVATAENIGPWLQEQGHKLVKIQGNHAYGNTIIDVDIYEQDEAPTALRKTMLKRPDSMPTAKVLRDKLDIAIKQV